MTELPAAMAGLPRDARGYVVFWTAFVDSGTGEPDFRVLEYPRVLEALKKRLCGMCGGRIAGNTLCLLGTEDDLNGRWGASWVRGTDPPMHEECARYALEACPFLSGKAVRRSGRPMPGDSSRAPGHTHRRDRPPRRGLFFVRSYEARWRDEIGGFRYARPYRVEWSA